MSLRIVSLCLLALAPLCAQQPAEPQPRYVDPGGPDRPPSDAVVLFDGKDSSNWTTGDGEPATCTVADGAMACKTGAGNIFSKQRFGSAQIHLEFATPFMPD